jgi:hypothetical protein
MGRGPVHSDLDRSKVDEEQSGPASPLLFGANQQTVGLDVSVRRFADALQHLLHHSSARPSVQERDHQGTMPSPER